MKYEKRSRENQRPTVVFNEHRRFRLEALFPIDDLHRSIEIKLLSEQIEFDDFNELKTYPDLPDKLSSFRIYISHKGKSIFLVAGIFNSSNTYVRAQSDSEAWCAGAVETAYTFVNSYRKWYSWLNAAPIGWFLLAYANIPLLLFVPDSEFNNKFFFFGWLFTFFTMGIIYVFKSKLFPPSTIVVRQKENIIRKYSAEISLLTALISVVISLLGWFSSRQ